jgi:hypothetical protein
MTYETHTQPPDHRNESTNGFAIASMVLGIVWVWWIGSILAVVFGHISLSQIKKTKAGGKGMAIAGLTLGYVGIGILAFLIATAIIAGFASDSTTNDYQNYSDCVNASTTLEEMAACD